MKPEFDKTSLSFGRYLQAIRIEKGISLEAVSKETRIRLETLNQIEAEDHEQLPNEVFVKGFLRAYAKAVGADGDEAVRRYASRREVARKITGSEAAQNNARGFFWRRLFVSLGALACLIALTLFGVSYWRESSVSSEAPEQVAKEAEENAVAAPKPEPASAPVAEEKADAPAGVNRVAEKRHLKISAVEDTWVKIIVDDQPATEYNLFPGDHIELEAARRYNLLIGNAGGVKLMLDDKPVEVPGKSGQVVNIELP